MIRQTTQIHEIGCFSFFSQYGLTENKTNEMFSKKTSLQQVNTWHNERRKWYCLEYKTYFGEITMHEVFTASLLRNVE